MPAPRHSLDVGERLGPAAEELVPGLANLEQHLANVAAHGVPAVAAINVFEEDTEEELRYVQERASGAVGAADTRHYAEGGMGAEGLADPSLKGRAAGFVVPVKDVKISAAAGFVVALRSGIQLMPGLPTRPAGEQMDLDPRTEDIRGLT